MAEKKIEVFYQAKGEETWRQVENGVENPPTARRAVRVLLEEADAAAARAIANRLSRKESARNLTSEELFERDMALAVGAWERYVKIEMKRLWSGVEDAFDKKRKG